MPKEEKITQSPRDSILSLLEDVKNYDVTHIGYTVNAEGFVIIDYFYSYDLDTLNRNNAYFTAILSHSTTTEADQTEIIDFYGGNFSVPTQVIRDFNNGLISAAEMSSHYICKEPPNAPKNNTNQLIH